MLVLQRRRGETTEGGSGDESSDDEAGAAAAAAKGRSEPSRGAPGDLPPSDSDEYTSSEDDDKDQVGIFELSVLVIIKKSKRFIAIF